MQLTLRRSHKATNCFILLIKIMSKPAYTSIPPTSDNVYWQLKFSDGKTSIYIPRDRELDRQLKIKYQAELAARNPSIRRRKDNR